MGSRRMGNHKENCSCPWHGGYKKYSGHRRGGEHKDGCTCRTHSLRVPVGIVECSACGKEFERYLRKIEGTKTWFTFCSVDCQNSREARQQGYKTGHPGQTYRNKALGTYEEKCVGCGIGPEWGGQRLVIEVDHIDGDRSNNNIENLRFLCPNCHSQTETHRGKNRGCSSTG